MNSGAFGSLHCLIYKVLARAPSERKLYYLTTFNRLCQALFSTFFEALQRSRARSLSDSSLILPESEPFVKPFLSLLFKFFPRARRASPSCQTA